MVLDGPAASPFVSSMFLDAPSSHAYGHTRPWNPSEGRYEFKYESQNRRITGPLPEIGCIGPKLYRPEIILNF
jgi:hypothetical protein